MSTAKNGPRSMKAEDLYSLSIITDARLSPDGRQVAYGVQRIDRKTEKKYANLWMASVDGTADRQFTQGDQKDGSPRWSPDGKHVAFLSQRKEGQDPQLYVIDVGGGEARQLTDLKGSINEFSWSPDGRRLLLEFQKKDKEEVTREADEQKKKLGVVSRHITRLFYRGDGEGWYPKERQHLWTVDLATGKATQLTSGDIYDENQASWSPDGNTIVFCSNRRPDPELEPDLADLYTIAARGGAVKLVPSPIGPKAMPMFSPDGSMLAYIGPRDANEWWQNVELWLLPLDGKGQARSLTRPHDISLTASTINDMGGAGQMPPTWSADGKVIYFQVSEHGNQRLMAVAIDDGALYTVIDGTGCVGTFTLDHAQRTMAYTWGTMVDPGQVWMRDMETGTSRQLTHVNAHLLKRLDLGAVEEVWYKARDGHDLQGWIMTPPGFDPAKTYPSILEIHGGPQAQYGNLFMHEFYFLAACGYIVYFTNPRGGTGYGEEHEKAIWGRWGTVDFDDVMDWADKVQKRPYIDRKRMGVTGGSYGGYMTNWIIGHTHRFAAAVTQRSVSNFISMWGTSDVNWVFQFPCGGKSPQQSIDVLWDRSPIKYLGGAKTPTMVLHNEMDFRCAIEQGQQVFTALRTLRVPTEFVVFPDEPHGLSRIGRTDRRIDRLNSIRRWMDTYLKALPKKAGA